MRMAGRYRVKCTPGMWDVLSLSLSLSLAVRKAPPLDIHFKPDHSITLTVLSSVFAYQYGPSPRRRRSIAWDYLRTPVRMRAVQITAGHTSLAYTRRVKILTVIVNSPATGAARIRSRRSRAAFDRPCHSYVPSARVCANLRDILGH